MRRRTLTSNREQKSEAVLSSGGMAGSALREIDWSASPLGPVSNWPRSLKFAVRVMLTSPMPMGVWWGPEFIQLGNDAYLSVLGGHLTAALGQPASNAWREIWDRLGPAAEAALGNNQGDCLNAPPSIRDRNGIAKESYFSFTFNPIPNDHGGAGGLFVVAADNTKRVIDQRQMALLRELTTSTAMASTIPEACELSARALASDPHDLPFALIYLFDPETRRLVLKSAAGIAAGEPAAPKSVALEDSSVWPFANVIQERKGLLVSDLADRLASPPMSIWQRPPRQAVLVPIDWPDQSQSGVLVAGLSPVRLYDDEYRDFIEMIASRIAVRHDACRQACANRAASKDPPRDWESSRQSDSAAVLARFRHEWESASRESEQRYRQLIQALPAAVYTTDADGRIALFNQAAVEIWGRAPELGKDRWSGAFRTLRVDGTPLLPAEIPMAIALKTEKPAVAEELIIEREDGSRRYVLAHPQPICDSTGKLIGAVNMLLDITERRLVEKAMHENEEWLRQATRTGKVGVWDLDVLANHVSWTESLYAIHGIKPGQFETTPEACIQLVHPEDRAGVSDAIAAAIDQGKPLEIEFRVVRPDGEVIWLFANGLAVREHDKPVRLRGVTVDITDRKRAIEALQKQTDRIHLLWRAAAILLTVEEPDAMLHALFDCIAVPFGLNVCLYYVLAEDAEALRLETSIGIPDEARSSIEMQQIGEGICGTAAQTRSAVIASRIQESNDPRHQLAKSLGIRAVVCKPIIAGTRLLGTLSFASSTRDEFEPSEIEFLRTITRYLTVAYERLRLLRELKQADQRKDEFLATLAHELRNPLAPLRNGLQILQLARTDPSCKESLDMMERQLDQMVRLIDDLLDVSRISRGKIELRCERVDLAEVIRSAVETSRPIIAEAGNMLFENVPIEPIIVHGDFARLAQVLANLLNNAAKYTPRGGRIELIADSRDGWVSISIRDNGIGIPDHMLPRIFDMFMQVDCSLEKAQGGLGIGLTIVKRLVEMHGGTVEARSRGPGMGSEFIVRLPAAAAVKHGGDDLAPAFNTPPSRILIVDDNKDAARSMATLLSMDGHETRTAFDGFEAFDIAADFRPDMILMDIGMPKLNGHDACRRIREQEWGKDIVMVALTGWGQEEDRRQSQDVGFDDHLVKPVKVSAIQAILSRCEPSRS